MVEVILEGKIITPVVTKKVKFYFKGYTVEIKPNTVRRRYFSKIIMNLPMFPYSIICYLGKLKLTFKCQSKSQGTKKLREITKIKQIGRFQSEGLGYIQWLEGYFLHPKPRRFYFQKLKIRKGLPQYLSHEALELIQYGLLHDFFHNSRHDSKIYVEPPLDDNEYIDLLKDHHENKNQSDFIQKFQYYDQLAARMTRKHRSPRLDRYNWTVTQKINFQELATKIAEVAHNAWKLYEVIYKSKELNALNESLQFGHTSLRTHFLTIANLIVKDYLLSQRR